MPPYRCRLIERICEAAPAADGFQTSQGKRTVRDRKPCHQSIVAAKNLFLAHPHEEVHIDEYRGVVLRGNFPACSTSDLIERIVHECVGVGKSRARHYSRVR